MEISDLTQAEFYLQHLNYYRLGAHWLPFESDHTTHTAIWTQLWLSIIVVGKKI